MLPDTHAHLDAVEFAEDCDVVIARAVVAGVSPILAVGSDLSSSRRAVELAARHPMVFAAVGTHPHEADRFVAQAPELRDLLAADKVVAVGEIGLDYYRDGVDRDTQREAFAEQLRWASELHLPVSVHNRDADDDVLAAVAASGVLAILHCFSGSRAFAGRALLLGCYLSLAGNLTFKRADDLRVVASNLPGDRLLVESDAPVLAPQQWRGRRNEPAHVAATAQTLADVRGVSNAEMEKTLAANAATVFNWEPA
ncbi:MAG: TatD family hydrolase [Chloroflexota bacterium]